MRGKAMKKKLMIMILIMLSFLVSMVSCTQIEDRIIPFDKNYLIFRGEKINYTWFENAAWNTSEVILFTDKNIYSMVESTYIGDVNSKSATQLTINGYEGFGYPVISPDQLFIAFYDYNNRMINIVTNDKVNEVVGIIDGCPSGIVWKNDNSEIIWGENIKVDDNQYEIVFYQYDLSQQKKIKIFEFIEPNTFSLDGLAVSPDGNILAFAVIKKLTLEEKQENYSEIYVYLHNENRLIKINHVIDSNEQSPSWYSNTIISYTVSDGLYNSGYYGKLTFYDLTTNCFRELPDVIGFDSPSWSIDKSRLAFIHENDIYVIPIEDLLGTSDLPKRICENSQE
jgi:Tol biopolymer transport system component